MNGRHAYLIETHNNFEILKYLVKTIDDERNDIYIHMDKKAQGFVPDNINREVKKSAIYYIEPLNVHWGGYSQILVEYNLLKAATEKGYARYHLISGVDFPIKTQDEIHEFFEQNADIEIVHFDYAYAVTPDLFKGRMEQYHLLRDKIDRSNKWLNELELFLVHAQKLLKLKRKMPEGYTMKKGANWFSITDKCANYIVSKEKWVRRHFKYTKCCDEVFLQTLVYNSEFKDHLYYDSYEKRNGNLRYVDWKRGNPYIFRIEDFDDLISSHYFFARKFDEKVDLEIVQKLYENMMIRGSKNDVIKK